MGTYTTNKNLFMPSVGEQGWGTLVNGNFETIDNFLKPISLSGSTYTFTGNHVGNQSGGSISATSITNSGTLTNTGTSTFTGKVTANGGIGTTSLTTSSTITSTGKITGNGGIGTTSLTTSGNITSNGTISATKIKQTGVTTVTTGTPTIALSGGADSLLFVLPDYTGTYTGSIKIFNNYTGTGYDDGVKYHTSWNTGVTTFNTPRGTVSTLSFTNVKHLYVYVIDGGIKYFGIGAVTLS